MLHLYLFLLLYDIFIKLLCKNALPHFLLPTLSSCPVTKSPHLPILPKSLNASFFLLFAYHFTWRQNSSLFLEFCYVSQAGLEFLGSSDPPASATWESGTTYICIVDWLLVITQVFLFISLTYLKHTSYHEIVLLKFLSCF